MPKPAKPKPPVQDPASPPAAPTHTPPPMPWDDASDDIVSDILRRVATLTPGFTAALAAQLDRDIRAHWGRDRCYIARRAGEGTSTRNAAIRRDHRNGERIGLLCRRYGLTRQRIHQILAQPGEEEDDQADVKRRALPA